LCLWTLLKDRLEDQTGIVIVYLKIDPKAITLDDGFARDVKNIGHFGTGDLELSLRTMEDFARAQPLFQRSYEGS
jgi:predicted transport protein